jgi:hypothetical protein
MAVAFGYYDQHWRSQQWSGPDLILNSLQGSPVGWSTIFLDRADVNDPPNVRNVSLTGGNVSEEEIRLDDAYLLSGISGDRLDLKVIWGGKAYAIKDIKPIPPRAIFVLVSDTFNPPKGISEKDFLVNWSIIYFVAEYKGQKQRITFDEKTISALLPKPFPPRPHISPQKQ